MNRKDRERDAAFAWAVLDEAPYGVLAMADETGAPYCIPVSMAREGRAVYFHCAKVGLKLNMIRKNPKVAMTAVASCRSVSPKYTMSYESAVLRGRAVIVEDAAEKRLALRRISEKYSAADLDKFDAMMEQYAKATCVVRIDVEEITGKEARNG